MEITRELAKKVDSVVSQGLVKGLGSRKPGHFCVEAAVCYALGEPHSDEPSCVGSEVRQFKIQLNDASWSSGEARTAGMREIAIAQLGSDTIYQGAFTIGVAVRTTREILPIGLRAVASLIPKYETELISAAALCEAVFDINSARKASLLANEVARAALDDATSVLKCSVFDEWRNIQDAAHGAHWAAVNVVAGSSPYTARAIYSARAAVIVSDIVHNTEQKVSRDSILRKAVQIGIDVLTELKCPGTKFLDVIQDN